MPRAGLDRARVVAAAAQLADSGGLEQLTLTRLAQQLGVRTPSLYAHVGGLDELRGLLASGAALELAGELERAAAGRAGGDALSAIADAYRAFAKAHPGTYGAIQRAQNRAAGAEDGAARVIGVLLAVMRGYGLSGDDALHAVRGVRSALHGFVALETGDGFGIPLNLDESYHRLVATLDRGLAAAQPAGAA